MLGDWWLDLLIRATRKRGSAFVFARKLYVFLALECDVRGGRIHTYLILIGKERFD